VGQEWDGDYGYQDFGNDEDESGKLNEIIHTTQQLGLHYMSDRDSRPQAGANPMGHLWDNGNNIMLEYLNLGILMVLMKDLGGA